VTKLFDFCIEKVNVFERYNVEYYLHGFGLCVNREYRGRNIATEMLKARVPFLKALGMEATATIFSGIGAQIAAKKAGYDEVFSMRFVTFFNDHFPTKFD
jgi:GNAT superfamily N-acetyltransferase